MLQKKKNNIIEKAQQEIIFAIKERIIEITGETCNVPVVLACAEVKEPGTVVAGSVKYLNIHNIFIDESGCLCGDLEAKGDLLDSNILFGACIEDLKVSDLKDILDQLYSDEWAITKDDSYYPEIPVSTGTLFNDQFRKYIQRSRIFSRIFQL